MTATLVILACLSPLLSFTRLWQIKAWRFDRLLEYLKHEAGFKALVGTVRPIIVLAAIIWRLNSSLPIIDIALILLVALGGFQLLLRRQPIPTFTSKTTILVLLALIFTALLVDQLGAWSILLILAQPLTLLAAWAVFWPIDSFMKKRIMRQAEQIRQKFPDLTVIGITGSAGKTTTKELLGHILDEANLAVTPAYLNADIGVARWLIKTLKRRNPPQILIIEMGAYRKGEIAALCRVARPTIGVLTSISNQHLGLFGSQENLQAAKAEILQAVPESGRVFINGDSPLALATKPLSSAAVVAVGTSGLLDLEATNIQETTTGLSFTLNGTTFTSPLRGTHNVTNLLLAIGVAHYLGLKDESIGARLSNFKPLGGTFSVTTKGNYPVLDDTHNLSAASFKAALAWAKVQPFDNITLVTPGIIELGSQTAAIHAELGAIADGTVDRFICLNKERAAMFAQGYKKPIEVYNKKVAPVTKNHLVLLLGRIPGSTLERLLPN